MSVMGTEREDTEVTNSDASQLDTASVSRVNIPRNADILKKYIFK